MTSLPGRSLVLAGLCIVSATLTVRAQAATQGMDASHTQHAAHEQPPPAHASHAVKPSSEHALHAGHVADTAGQPDVAKPPPVQPPHAMAMPGMPGKAATGPRSPDYSDGYRYGAMNGMDMRDDAPLGMLLFDRLEAYDGRDDHGAAFDVQAWYGNEANKLWLKAEGESAAGRLQDLRVEALWDRPVTAFWDLQLGARHDGGVGPERNWVAFGIQGLAPYWFEVQATVYVGPSGRSAFRFESDYELLLTQRLILQPRFEMNLYGRDDLQRGVGSGLSDAALGLRLRYEFTRQFAPYVGLEFERRFGAAARFARADRAPAFDPRIVAGLRFWF